MAQLFSNAGFDPQRDIAGIVLSRWGHAYANAGRDFSHGLDGQPTPGEVLRQRLGTRSFVHTELAGIGSWGNTGDERLRAERQALETL